MKQETAAFKVNTLITTHQNADFDALAATVGAAKLYPDARIVFPGSMNRNVREFAGPFMERDCPLFRARGLVFGEPCGGGGHG